jgi:hypothetical protein
MVGMSADPDERHTLSFVIRIWLESEATRLRPKRWRGHITHVPSGKRRYFERLALIGEVIEPYLDALGGPVPGRANRSGRPRGPLRRFGRRRRP